MDSLLSYILFLSVKILLGVFYFNDSKSLFIRLIIK